MEIVDLNPEQREERHTAILQDVDRLKDENRQLRQIIIEMCGDMLAKDGCDINSLRKYYSEDLIERILNGTGFKKNYDEEIEDEDKLQ
jgi:hypothetical protein